jgi:type II secretory pathway pseudopilin PulG
MAVQTVRLYCGSKIMGIAALVVAIVAALAAVSAVWYARRSDRSAAAAAAAAATTAALDMQRRNAELTPQFRITCEPANHPGSPALRLGVFLSGPPELERLDALTVTIRDDHPWRGQGTPLAGGPMPEQVAAQIWGPYRFTPGTGPGADSVRGIPGADPTGRTTPTAGMPVGEELPFSLEPMHPPTWSQQPYENWRRERGTVVRLRLECRRQGWDPWVLTCEVDPDGESKVEIP